MANFDRDKMREKIATACRMLCHEVENFDFSGHISVRLPNSEGLSIKGRHAAVGAMSRLTAAQIVTADFNGNLAEGNYSLPTEIFLHTQIYRCRPDVQSVVHTHQKLATVFTMVDRPLIPVHHPIFAREVFGEAGEPLPKYPSPDLIYTREQGDAVAKALGTRDVVLLQGHGVVVVGSSLEEATLKAISLEKQAEWNLMGAHLGSLIPIPIPSLQRARKGQIEGRWRYYCSLIENR